MKSGISTKFNIPQQDARLLLRARITKLFEHSLQRRLTLVSAPAGYGKTTSVVIWLHSLADSGIKKAWYALDAEDNEYTTFFTRFVAALETAMPGALSSVATGLTLQAISLGNYANVLVEACHQLPYEVVLVLDDYHLITAPDIHAIIIQLIKYASDRLHLVVVARHDPLLQIPLLRARQQLVEIHAADLKLVDSEAAALLRLRLDWEPSPELVSLLQARTEGWVAGLQLAAVSLSQGSQAEFIANIRRHESIHVIDFLVDEVLDDAPPDVREFMFKTSLVACFNIELAAAMTELDASVCGRVVDQLRRANLFLVAMDSVGTWFRYHHQFRAMLVNRASVLFPTETTAAIRRAAVDWLVSHGMADEALAEYAASGQWDKAAELIEAGRHALQNRQEWHRLWRQLQTLPENVVAHRPGLLLAKAWILQIHRRDVALVALTEQAAALLHSPTTTTPAMCDNTPDRILWGEIHALRSTPYRQDVPLEQRLDLIQTALQDLWPPEAYGWVRGYVYTSLVHVLLSRGQRDDAYRQILCEMDTVGLDSGPYLARLHQALGNILYNDGSLEELQQVCARYLDLALQYDLPVAAAFARYGIGWALYQRCAPAQQVLDALRPIYDRLPMIHLHTALLSLPILVAAAADVAHEEAAAHVLQLVGRTALERENIVALDEVSAASAYAALLRGERSTAMAWAEDFLRTQTNAMSEQTDLAVWVPRTFICAKIVLYTGASTKLEQTAGLLQRATDSVLSRGLLVEALQGAVLLASCYWHSDLRAKALRWMERAIEIGMPRGFRRVYFEQGAAVAEMLYTLLQRGVCTEAASTLLAEYAAWSSDRPPGRLVRRPEACAAIYALTAREEDILTLLAEELSNKEIAKQLHISAITVRNHTSRIYSKLEVNSRKSAVARAKALHLIP